MSIVALEEVTKVYWLGGHPTYALNGVTLTVEEGEFTAIVGPSGSGKTTLLSLIGCLEKPTRGRVLFRGQDTTPLSTDALADLRRYRIGFVFQYFNLIPVLSAYENVEFPLLLAGQRGRHEQVRELLAAVGIADRAHHRPLQLSGGEQQRVAIARSLAGGPDLVLADEPTGNLDSKTTQEILELMSTLNREQGVTFLFATHDPLVITKARRKVYLRDGMIVQIEENAGSS